MANVVRQHPHQIAIGLVGLVDLHRTNLNALFKRRHRVGQKATRQSATHIGPVRSGGGKADPFAFKEHRCVNHDVVQMLATGAGVVGENHVPRLKTVFTVDANTVFHRRIQVTHKQRQAPRCLGHQTPLCIQQAGTKVLHLIDDGAVRGAGQVDGDFFCNGGQGVVDHLDRDGVDAVGFAVTLHGGLPRAR